MVKEQEQNNKSIIVVQQSKLDFQMVEWCKFEFPLGKCPLENYSLSDVISICRGFSTLNQQKIGENGSGVLETTWPFWEFLIFDSLSVSVLLFYSVISSQLNYKLAQYYGGL